MNRGARSDNAPLRRLGTLLLVLLAVGFLPACSSGFGKAWRGAPTSAPDGISGRWEGQWVSEVSGHSGRLRCVVRPEEDGHTFHYHALWAWVMRFAYELDGAATEVPGGWDFKTENDLGLLFGDYTSRGTIRGDVFKATYRGGLDHGTFEMRRP